MADRDRSASAKVTEFPTTNPLGQLEQRAVDELREIVERALDTGAFPLPEGLERSIRFELAVARLRGDKGQLTIAVDLAKGQLAEWQPGSSGHNREKRKS